MKFINRLKINKEPDIELLWSSVKYNAINGITEDITVFCKNKVSNLAFKVTGNLTVSLITNLLPIHFYQNKKHHYLTSNHYFRHVPNPHFYNNSIKLL